jgi:hypothetical protein
MLSLATATATPTGTATATPTVAMTTGGWFVWARERTAPRP